MYFYLMVFILIVGVIAVGSLVYQWLIVSQRNQSYGTIVLPKRGRRGAGPVERVVTGVRDALVSLVKPIDWRRVGMRAGLVRIDSNTRPAGRG